jgi:hypothetical protein
MVENEYQTLNEAIDNKEDDEAVVDMGMNHGFKIIPAENW